MWNPLFHVFMLPVRIIIPYCNKQGTHLLQHLLLFYYSRAATFTLHIGKSREEVECAIWEYFMCFSFWELGDQYTRIEFGLQADDA
jgi:hypothetical protein